MAYKMKGSQLYGKLKLNRNMDDSSKTDGRAKSSAFQADKDEFPGLLPEVEVKKSDHEDARDRLAKKAKASRSGVVNPGMEQSAKSQDYSDADKYLASQGDKAAKKRLEQRKKRTKMAKKELEKNPDMTQKEKDAIMMGNKSGPPILGAITKVIGGVSKAKDVVDKVKGGIEKGKSLLGLKKHGAPMKKASKPMSKAMKAKVREAKAKNTRDTNKILVKQGKDPVKDIKEA